MSYDTVLQVFGDDAIPLDFQRLIILGSYCEFIGKRPESSDHAGQNHMILLKSIAAEAKLLLGRKEERKKSRSFVKFRRIDICYQSSVFRLPKTFQFDSPISNLDETASPP